MRELLEIITTITAGTWAPRDQISPRNLPQYDMAMRATPPDCRGYGLWEGGNAELPISRPSQAALFIDSASFSSPACDDDGVFRYPQTFRAHLASVHRQGLECPEPDCDKVFPSSRPGILLAHMRRIHSDYCYRKCEDCGKVFSSPTMLKRHDAKVYHPDNFKWMYCKRATEGCEFTGLVASRVKLHEI